MIRGVHGPARKPSRAQHDLGRGLGFKIRLINKWAGIRLSGRKQYILPFVEYKFFQRNMTTYRKVQPCPIN